MNMLEIPQGAGSGFVWDNKGHVVRAQPQGARFVDMRSAPSHLLTCRPKGGAAGATQAICQQGGLSHESSRARSPARPPGRPPPPGD